ncbi:MAG: tetratricopeptide repeat protein [Defluviitaleaceae bacterium]|nr:tetratricopeptide repeat protein [Defluviitaleaceae bacterium]MCL2239971.1 tetratricopeptide repeat protein [Defluviitaleaceae bacterium]
MKTVAFYSYKGGAGRTLALAYTAKYLAENHFSVCILDMDLEAPGILYKFDPEPDRDKLHNKPGVLEYIHSCIDGNYPESVSEYIHTYEITPNGGYIKLMSAGKGLNLTYWKTLAKMNWDNLFFGEDNNGLLYFEYLKHQIETEIKPDFLFIDSRSGITVLSKLCTMALADKTIVFSANNRENYHGTGLMYRQIASASYHEKNQKIDVFCALTRIPMPLSAETSAIVAQAKKKLIEAVGAPGLSDADITVIHSERKIEMDEQNILRKNTNGRTQSHIYGDYYRLITKIISTNELTNKRKSIFNKSEYYFYEYDNKGRVEELLETLRGGQSINAFYSDLQSKKASGITSCDILYKSAVYNRYNDNLTDAIADLSTALRLDAGKNKKLQAEICYLRGLIFLYDFNNYNDAKIDFEMALSLNKSINPTLRYELAICLLGVELFDEALKMIQAYIKINKTDYKGYHLKGVVKASIKNKINLTKNQMLLKKREIIKLFTKSIELNDRYKHSYNDRGVEYYDIGDFERALIDYNKAIELDSKFTWAYNNRGNAYASMNEIERALDDYNKAIGINPNYMLVHNNRGYLYMKRGDNDNALHDFNRAIELNPQNALAYINRSELYKKMGRNEEAELDEKKYHELTLQG